MGSVLLWSIHGVLPGKMSILLGKVWVVFWFFFSFWKRRIFPGKPTLGFAWKREELALDKEEFAWKKERFAWEEGFFSEKGVFSLEREGICLEKERLP